MVAHIMDFFSYGLASIAEFKHPHDIPPFEAVMENMAGVMDRLLTPAGGGNNSGYLDCGA